MKLISLLPWVLVVSAFPHLPTLDSRDATEVERRGNGGGGYPDKWNKGPRDVGVERRGNGGGGGYPDKWNKGPRDVELEEEDPQLVTRGKGGGGYPDKWNDGPRDVEVERRGTGGGSYPDKWNKGPRSIDAEPENAGPQATGPQPVFKRDPEPETPEAQPVRRGRGGGGYPDKWNNGPRSTETVERRGRGGGGYPDKWNNGPRDVETEA